MYIKSILLSILVTLIFSCCSNKRATTNNNKREDFQQTKTMNLNLYKRLSENRIKDSLKIADASYLYDYQVSVEEKVDLDEKIIKRIEKVINNEMNFYDNSVLNQCNPKPDFFIEWKNGEVYAFNLESNCPVMHKITFRGANSTVIKKYIRKEKIQEFVFISNFNK